MWHEQRSAELLQQASATQHHQRFAPLSIPLPQQGPHLQLGPLSLEMLVFSFFFMSVAVMQCSEEEEFMVDNSSLLYIIVGKSRQEL